MPDHEFEYVRIEPWANYKELFSFSHDGIQECGLSRDEVYDKIVKVLYGTEKDRLAHVEQVRRAEIARLGVSGPRLARGSVNLERLSNESRGLP